MLKLFNTYSAQLEEIRPLVGNRVRMYTCGPTVYDFAHIGNFRTFLYEDILRRYLKFSGYELTHVMNITDVDDKTIRNSGAQEPRQLREYTDQYTRAFFEDLQTLRVEKADIIAHATDHIPEMVQLIQALLKKDFAYEREGSIYFRIARFPNYGKLAKLNLEGMKLGSSVDLDEYEKDDVRDFVLWKAPKEGEPFWQTDIGPGRPGWHVECSAMSMKFLGPHFDIHCGGVDNIFPHHENEIAQSEAATGHPFVNYWIHGEHLLVDGQKMSKSLGNFYTLRDLLQRDLSPRAIRYTLASVPHRRQLNFTFDSVQQSAAALGRIDDFLLRLRTAQLKPGLNESMEDATRQAHDKFVDALDDDLNTAQALAAVFDLIYAGNLGLDQGAMQEGNRASIGSFVDEFNAVFAVLETQHEMLDAEIDAMIQERQKARRRRDFARADEIRNHLLTRGIILEDTKDGVRWKRK